MASLYQFLPLLYFYFLSKLSTCLKGGCFGISKLKVQLN